MTNRNSSKGLICILSAAMIGTFTLGTFSAAFAARNDILIEEVIVTARKREENLQDTPIAVSAFSAAALEYRGASDIGDLAQITPNLVFQNNPSFGGSSNAASVYIRGVGQREFLPTVDPGVGIYVDGVYVARSVGAILDLIDVERVEVLRGPQGTLFGRNTIGGAISITTRKPGDTLAGSVDAKLGVDQRANLKATIDIPFNDFIFSKFSAATLNQDGYLTRQDGLTLGDDDTLALRAGFLVIPSDDVEINLSLEYTEDNESGPPLVLTGIAGDVLSPNTPPFATIHNVLATLMAGGPEVPCAVGGERIPLPLDVPNCYDNSFVQGMNFDAGTAPTFSDTEVFGASANIEWSISDSLTFRSITAYRELDSQFARDGDHSPFVISQFFDNLQQDQVSQEFQLLGDLGGGDLEWILGAYYFEEDGFNQNLLDFVVSSFQSGGAFENESTAVFAQATWHATDRLSATFGLRYTEDSKSFTPDQFIISAPLSGNMAANPQLALFNAPPLQVGEPVLPSVQRTIDIEETTPLVNFAYQFTDTLMSYVSYSEGFKSGGFTQRVFPPQVAGFLDVPPGTPDRELIPTFEPEFVQVYEIGAKYRSGNGRLTLNAAAFRTEYDDLQVQVFTSVAPVTTNAGAATIDGVELELQALPGEAWLLDASLGYLDAGYDSIDFLETLIDPANELERVPEWSLSGGLSREFTLGGGGTLTPRLDWSFQSSIFNDAFNTPALQTDSYSLYNVRLNWSSSDNKYGIAAGVNNLGDEEFLITGIQGDAMQAIEALFDRGRQWFVEGKFRF